MSSILRQAFQCAHRDMSALKRVLLHQCHKYQLVNLTSLRRVIFADSTPTALTMSEISTHAETLQGIVTAFLPLLMSQTHCLGPQLRSGGGTFFF